MTPWITPWMTSVQITKLQTGVCKSDPVYMSSIACDNVCVGIHDRTPQTGSTKSWVRVYNNRTAIQRTKRCFGAGTMCLWELRDRHTCNGHEMCVATPADNANNELQIAQYHGDVLDSLTHPGFYVIKNDHRKCLSVQGNYSFTNFQQNFFFLLYIGCLHNYIQIIELGF